MNDRWLFQRLEDTVGRLVREFPGVAGVSLKDLKFGSGFSIRGDEIFPTASTIKIHILTQLLTRAEHGELDLNQKIQVTPQLHVPGSGVLTYLEGDVSLTLLDIAILMITVSDNTATNMCIDWAGMDATNALLRDLGLVKTMLRRKMQDQDAVARNEENIATPNECVAMLELLSNGKPTARVAERCLSILKKYKSGLFNRALPPGVMIANKPGGMERVRCDAGIVYLSRRPYAIAVMTNFALSDAPDHEYFVINVARAVHQTMLALDTTSDFGQGILH